MKRLPKTRKPPKHQLLPKEFKLSANVTAAATPFWVVEKITKLQQRSGKGGGDKEIH